MKIAVQGTHPLLQEITNKFSLTTPSKADLFVVGDNSYLPSITKPVIYLSSYAVYCGMNHRYKVSEDDAVSIHPLSDLSCSVISHLRNETYVLNEMKRSIVLRTFPVYGHVNDTSFINKLRHTSNLYKYRLGWRTRTFLYKDDFIEGLHKACDGLLSGITGLYNIGSEEEFTIQEIANLNSRIRNLPDNCIDEEWIDLPWRPTKIIPNTERFSITFDWKPKTSLSNGIRYLQHK